MRVRSGDTEIFYDVLGSGPAVVLLHAFPANHNMWRPAAAALESRYRVILPDLRGHGNSGSGAGPATMDKHAADLARVLDDAGVERAIFAGVSIGGYVLFEFWRRMRERVRALALFDTKAQADTPEQRAGRLKAAEDVLARGPEPFIDSMIPRLLGETTRTTRPDLVHGAREMMATMSVQGIAAVQQGMAARPDSVETLGTITVPTLVVTGGEDVATPLADAKLMRSHLQLARLEVIPKAGHYAVYEQPREGGRLLRQFVESAGS